MSATVVELDSRRRKVSDWLFCLFCGHRWYGQYIAGRKYSECPKCDETATVPEWTQRYGR